MLPLLSLVLLGFAQAGTDKYPNAQLLLEPAELTKSLATANLLVLDTRSREKYQAGHIPGSLWVDAAAWGKAFDVARDAKAWSERLGALGLDTGSRVIVYGDPLPDAARVWWILRYWGLQKVQLLNGGWPAWVAAGGETNQAKSPVRPTQLNLIARTERLATKDFLLEQLKTKKTQFLDARTRAEYCGDDARARRAGAIPGAVHLEWTDLLDAKTRRFKTPAELAKLFQTAGIKLDEPLVSYCQSGGRAAVTAFALELMGAKEVRNYYRSWAEWGNAEETPVVKPK